MANINTDHLVIGDNTLVLRDADLRSKKVNAFQNSPDDSHYPSEKLVKDSLDAKLNNSQKGASNGVAELGSDGKVPSSQLPAIPDVSTKYDTGDTASTALADADYIPFYDTSASSKKKTLWSGIKAKLKNYFDTLYLTSHQDISGKADKVASPTSGNFAALDSSGNMRDSGHKHSDYLTSHQDISGKADKVSNANNGNLAKLDANGNIADSGVATSDVNDAVSKKHSHSNKSILDLIPTRLGTPGQIPSVGDNSDIVWADFPTELYVCSFSYENNTLACDKTVRQILAASEEKLVVGILLDNNIATTFVLKSTEYSGGLVFFDTIVYTGNILAKCLVGRMEGNSDIWEFTHFPIDVNGTNDGTNWTSLTIKGVTKLIPSGGGGGLSDYDFTHTANTTVSTSSTTITFAANQRCSQMITVSADIDLSIVCNNLADNYIWIKNNSSGDVDITISGITLNGNTIAAANIRIAGSTMTVKAGNIIELGIVCNADGAFVTSRNDL